MIQISIIQNITIVIVFLEFKIKSSGSLPDLQQELDLRKAWGVQRRLGSKWETGKHEGRGAENFWACSRRLQQHCSHHYSSGLEKNRLSCVSTYSGDSNTGRIWNLVWILSVKKEAGLYMVRILCGIWKKEAKPIEIQTNGLYSRQFSTVFLLG